MVAIIDYDAGNLKSVEKAFAYLGEPTAVTRSREEILTADRVVLPGVGAFGDAMSRLEQYGLADALRETAERGIPLLGICLGLQLFFESSEESPGVKGLGLCRGRILRFPEKSGMKIPHMGWNSLHYDHPGRLFAGIEENSYVYFVHSYYLEAEDPQIVTASAQYTTRFHASIEENNIFACQFHPEKSGEVGLAILKNFLSVGRLS